MSSIEFASKENCLFLAEWEVSRCACHVACRKKAESDLCHLQLQIQNALAAVTSWLTILETHRKLNEVAAEASFKALEELEARWKPVRLQAYDGPAADWLLASEKSFVDSLTASAQVWASAVPDGGQNLRIRQQALADHVQSSVVKSFLSWDQSHQAALQAWLSHKQRLEDTVRAVAEERAPPDAWLSEVRYRELARKHLREQAAAGELLSKACNGLGSLEVERASYWERFTTAYQGALSQGPTKAHQVAHFINAPDVQNLGIANVQPLLQIPDMPTSSGAVLQCARAALSCPGGVFGLGGQVWKEGAILVLTLHGYLHLFCPDAKTLANAETDSFAEIEAQLVEAAIRASVYVPMATKCVFQRRGKDLTLDLAEQEIEAAESPPSGASAAVVGLRKFFSKPGIEPIPRRVHTKLFDSEKFTELEKRCHEFVRHRRLCTLITLLSYAGMFFSLKHEKAMLEPFVCFTAMVLTNRSAIINMLIVDLS